MPRLSPAISLADVVAPALRCAASPRRARLAENHGKPSLWVFINAPWYQLLVRQRTTLINGLRAHLAEFGIVTGVGRNGLERLLGVIEDDRDERTLPPARDCLMALLTRPTFLLNQRSSVSVDAGPRFDPTGSGD